MSVNARPTSAQFEAEIHMDSDDRPMSQDAEPNVGPDAEPDAEPNAKPDAEPDAKSNIRQVTHSPSGRELRTWISESDWTRYIKDVPHVPRAPTSAVSIFRVHEFLKNTKKEAYVPQRVSLGPYHHRIAKFSPMDHYKGRALRGMMEKKNKEKGLDSDPYNINMDFANHAKGEILKVEEEIRDSYEENIACDGETLARMLCLDGCFLLQVLRTLGRDESLGADLSMQLGNKENEIIVKENEIIVFSSREIMNDVLMLENQVPFIVLRKLLRLELNSTNDVDFDKLLSKMVMGCIRRLLEPSYIFRYYIKEWCDEKLAGEEKVQHLLSFLYEAIVFLGFGPIEFRYPIEDTNRGPVCSICIDCLDSCMYTDRGPVCNMFIDCLCRRMCIDCVDSIMQYQVPNHSQRILPAVELRNAGIKFKPCHGSIKKIKFDRKSATIFLPPICITDITEVLFRNLIAFEVCRPSQIKYASCYVNIMDNLIDSQKDVALLRRMGVLTNRLGRDNEVVDLFNGLSKAAAPLNLFDAFHRLAERVNAHYENEIRVQLQLPKLVQDYCSTPWKALASGAAIVLLLLTLLQTIFTIISVYK